jgi:hypothetical protein
MAVGDSSGHRTSKRAEDWLSAAGGAANFPTVLLYALALTLASTGSVADSRPPAQVKLVTGNFRFVGLTPELGAFIPEHVAQRLQRPGLQVVTSSDLQTLLGLERQRQLLGCNDSSTTCLAELTGALGADGVLLGEVAKVGAQLQVNLKVISGRDGHALAAFARRVESQDLLLDALDQGADALAREVLAPVHPASTGPVAAAVATAAPSQVQAGSRRWWWLPGAVGVACAGGGGALLLMAKSNHDQFYASGRPSPLEVDAAVDLANRGATYQTVGFIGLGAGAAALATAAGLALFGDAAPVTVAVAPGRAAWTLTAQGSFP